MAGEGEVDAALPLPDVAEFVDEEAAQVNGTVERYETAISDDAWNELESA